MCHFWTEAFTCWLENLVVCTFSTFRIIINSAQDLGSSFALDSLNKIDGPKKTEPFSFKSL